MATRPWIFLINTFYSNTVDTIKNALSLTNDHLAKLTANEADADILAIKTIYLPLHNAFITAYNQLDARLGIYHGKTVTFEEMMEELAKEKINAWRGTVFAVFPEQTADAEAIFPRNREPFQGGTYDERVEAVRTFSEVLATYTTKPTLVTLSTETLAYYTTLTGARALQQTDEGSVDTLRTNLKTMHGILCTGLYRNLGGLMAKYAETPATVANYYDLSLLRKTGDDDEIILNGIIAPGGTIKNIFTGELPAGAFVEASATGGGYDIYFSETSNGASNQYHAEVMNETKNFGVGQIGYETGLRQNLNLQNNGTTPVTYTIRLFEQ